MRRSPDGKRLCRKIRSGKSQNEKTRKKETEKRNREGETREEQVRTRDRRTAPDSEPCTVTKTSQGKNRTKKQEDKLEINQRGKEEPQGPQKIKTKKRIHACLPSKKRKKWKTEVTTARRLPTAGEYIANAKPHRRWGEEDARGGAETQRTIHGGSCGKYY